MVKNHFYMFFLDVIASASAPQVLIYQNDKLNSFNEPLRHYITDVMRTTHLPNEAV